jgi:hypothetical protein
VEKAQQMADKIVGLLLAGITVLVICKEWGAPIGAELVLPLMEIVVLSIFAFQVKMARKAFIAVAVGMTLILAATNPDWRAITQRGLATAAFIAAFFSTLSTLRTAAQTSPAIQRAGKFLSGQKPGRRYAALTVGGQMFALLLNYGAIQLLGTLAMANARAEPNAEVRFHRMRRMLLAIQRAFISSLPWSPLSFSVAITTSMIPNTSWAEIVLPGLVTSAIVAGIGWGLDTAFKPKLSVPAQRSEPEGNWLSLAPLLTLLGILVVSVFTLYSLTGVRVVGIVAMIVPMMAVGWLFIQTWRGSPLRDTGRRIRDYLFEELPSYRGEITLLMMAGYIGTIGAQLLIPLMAQTSIDLGQIAPWVIVVSFVWLIPVLGQFGMNPILAVTLIAPLIPHAEDLGVTPTALVVAITAGWTLSGASSPFTATTLLIGNFAGISALKVGLNWNGAYTLICAVALSIWVYAYGFLL